jgi:hypothetical protein
VSAFSGSRSSSSRGARPGAISRTVRRPRRSPPRGCRPAPRPATPGRRPTRSD